jgi:ketosteroid isomerase-like protein
LKGVIYSQVSVLPLKRRSLILLHAKIFLSILLVMTTITSYSQSAIAETSAKIIALEKAALDKWNQGDPGGYIDLSADDVVYFDPYLEQRLDGLQALKNYYEPIRGQINARYEMLNPKVQLVNEMAVLTFNLISYEGEKVLKWNCTEVYRLEKNDQWKIVQTHWSFIKPELK